MITRHESTGDKMDIWAQLSAPLPAGVIEWRQDGRAIQRDGKFFARFLCYVESNTVRERLDTVVPGEWDLTLELLPPIAADSDDDATCAFKARLQILGVIREDVGMGRDYKAAATDAFKRAGVRFGIAHELYSYEQNWVQVDGDGKFAKPVEDPGEAYARRHGDALRGRASAVGGEHAPANGNGERREEARDEASASPATTRPEPTAAPSGPLATDEPSCPKCGGRVWDNRLSKRNPKAPDYKCRSRSCDGVIWPPKANGARDTRQQDDDGPPPYDDGDARIPF